MAKHKTFRIGIPTYVYVEYECTSEREAIRRAKGLEGLKRRVCVGPGNLNAEVSFGKFVVGIDPLEEI